MNNGRKYSFFILFVNIRNSTMLIKSKNIIFFRFLVFYGTANAPVPNIFNLYTSLHRFLLYILNIFSLPVYFFNIKYILLTLSVLPRSNIRISNHNNISYAIVSRILCRCSFSSDRDRLLANISECRWTNPVQTASWLVCLARSSVVGGRP